MREKDSHRTKESSPVHKAKLEAKMRLGFIVFGVLVILEVVEYGVGASIKHGAWPYLAILAAVGAWPIVQYFMHILQLWRREE